MHLCQVKEMQAGARLRPFDPGGYGVLECALSCDDQDDQEVWNVARSCEVCGKGPAHGHKISHAHNVSSRVWYPNIQRLRVVVGKTRRRMKVCTRCLRANRVVKAAPIRAGKSAS
jgi:large subunit ribosomal protein L28